MAEARAPVLMSVGYPSPTASLPTTRARSPSGGSAETFVLVALILQVIGAVFLFLGIALLFGVSIFHPYPFAVVAVVAGATIAVTALVFLYAAYEFSYRRIQQGEYQQAKTPTLVIGILSLFLGIIPGIFYLIGYIKLDDAIREQQGYGGGVAPGYGPAFSPTAQAACLGCGRLYPIGQVSFCPACGRKLGG